jgi:hypothetical protein
MARVLYAAAPEWAGTWHRFRVINHVKTFADHAGYRVYFLWGVTGAVSWCRYEELLSPVPGVEAINVSEPEIRALEKAAAGSKTIRYGNRSLTVYRDGGRPGDEVFAFDLSAADPLERLARSRAALPGPLRAIPAADIGRRAGVCIRDMDLRRRVGIRVRVSECRVDWRKPRRFQRELDDTVKSIVRIPWHVPVFVVTDSEYVQQMLASHFHDTKFLPKRFTEKDSGGRYVDRHDRESMLTFLAEVMCLTSCRKIVNVGGCLNQESFQAKIVDPPYDNVVLPERSMQNVNGAGRR